MEDDLEEYWAAIRPAPKPSLKNLRDELLKISKLREEEWALMTHRNIPPPPERLFENPDHRLQVINLGNSSAFDDRATREYVLQSHPAYSFQVDQTQLETLQVQPTEVQVGVPQENIGIVPLSGGEPTLVSSGSSASTFQLRLAGNNDFTELNGERVSDDRCFEHESIFLSSIRGFVDSLSLDTLLLSFIELYK